MAGFRPPVFGRPSPAASKPSTLRRKGRAGTAAYRTEAGDAGPLVVRAATVAGARHRLAGVPGQDSFAWSVASGALALAIADGVSAVDGAEFAAAVAVASATDALAELCERPGGPDGQAAATATAAASEALVAAGWRQPATTLVVAAVVDDGRWWAARVGDSTAMTLCASSWRSVFVKEAEDDEGSLVLPETDALPSESEPQLAEGTLGAGEALLLFTDGIAGPLADGPETVAPELATALSDPPTPLHLAGLADFERQGCMDDRTVAGVWLSG